MDFLIGEIGPGRVVGIGDEDGPRARRDALENGIHIGRKIVLRRDHRLSARRENGDAEDQESVLGVDRLVARPEIGLRQNVKQLVRTVSADDVRRIRPVEGAERLAKEDSLMTGPAPARFDRPGT